MRVSEILRAKGKPVVTIKPTHTAAELSILLRERHVGAAIVSTDGATIEGVISERDLAYALSIKGARLAECLVAELMTRKVISCSPDDNAGRVASLMRTHGVRHLPVVQDGKVLGMVSIRDVLNVRVDELQQQTAELRNWLSHSKQLGQDRHGTE